MGKSRSFFFEIFHPFWGHVCHSHPNLLANGENGNRQSLCHPHFGRRHFIDDHRLWDIFCEQIQGDEL